MKASLWRKDWHLCHKRVNEGWMRLYSVTAPPPPPHVYKQELLFYLWEWGTCTKTNNKVTASWFGATSGSEQKWHTSPYMYTYRYMYIPQQTFPWNVFSLISTVRSRLQKIDPTNSHFLRIALTTTLPFNHKFYIHKINNVTNTKILSRKNFQLCSRYLCTSMYT